MKHWKKLLSLFLVLAMMAAFASAALAAEPEEATEAAADETAAEDITASEEEADAAPEAPRPVILVVSYGTGYTSQITNSIGAVEKALGKAYPDHEIRRAFFSQAIREKLAERNGLEIDGVAEALDRLAADGVRDVIVQPTFVVE